MNVHVVLPGPGGSRRVVKPKTAQTAMSLVHRLLRDGRDFTVTHHAPRAGPEGVVLWLDCDGRLIGEAISLAEGEAYDPDALTSRLHPSLDVLVDRFVEPFEATAAAPALFVPLAAEPYAAFESGEKRIELRQFGPRWNYRTIQVGRPVVLSKGYGRGNRLMGKVGDVWVRASLDALPPEVREAALGDRTNDDVEEAGYLDPSMPVIAFRVDVRGRYDDLSASDAKDETRMKEHEFEAAEKEAFGEPPEGSTQP